MRSLLLKLFILSLLVTLCLAQFPKPAIPGKAKDKAKGKAKGNAKGNAKDNAKGNAKGNSKGNKVKDKAMGKVKGNKIKPVAIGAGAGAAGAAGAAAAASNNKTTNQTGGLATVYTECLKPGQFVLTFDDGPKMETTPKALEVLKQNGIKGTFFINSANYVDLENSAEARNLVQTVFEAGHDIGSHTYQHKDLFQAMEEGLLELNVDKNNEIIQSIIGYTPVFFRPPLGNGGFTQEYCAARNIAYDPRTEQVRKYLGERGMKVIMWNADTQDWASENNVENAINQLALSVSGQSPQNASFITLLHDVHPYTVDVILQEVINYVRQQGYEFVSLSECIGEAPYLEGYNPNQFVAGETGSNLIDGDEEELILESSSIKNVVTSLTAVLVYSIINILLY